MYFDHYFLHFKAEINNNINIGILQSNQIHPNVFHHTHLRASSKLMQLRDPAVSTDILFFGASDFDIDNPALSCGSLIVFLIITYIIPAAVQIPFLSLF
jgi:hypothetical protein